MAGRPEKRRVDFFSHDAGAGSGRTLTILFNNFGHEGISAWWLLLETLSGARDHTVRVDKREDFEYLAAKLHFQPQRFKEILNKMAELDAIDKDLYTHGCIWSQNFVNRLEGVYKARGQSLPPRPSPDNSISGTDNSISGTGCIPPPKVEADATSISPPPKVKESKVKESKVKEIEFPDWINRVTWNDFLEMRRKMKKIPTEHAKQLLIKDLEQLKSEGNDPNKVLEESIKRNWTGLFPLKEQYGGQDGTRKRVSSRTPPEHYTDPDEFYGRKSQTQE